MAYERSRSAFTAGPVGSNSTPNNKDWVVIRSSFQEVNQEAKAMIANPSSDANIYHCELRPLRLDSLYLRRPDHRTFQDSSKGRHLNASPRCRNPGFGSHTLDASSERSTGQYHIQHEELKHKPLPLEPLGALEPQAATIVHKSHWCAARLFLEQPISHQIYQGKPLELSCIHLKTTVPRIIDVVFQY